MDYDKIRYTVYEIYKSCDVVRLPFDCFDVLYRLGYKVTEYDSLTEESRSACMRLSEDACIVGNEIFYNGNKPKRRIRFSLMHELGHLMLNTVDEAEANNFASTILAPSIAVHYSRLTNVRELSNLFDISLECAQYALESCTKWVYSVKGYGMTDIDKRLYHHFYDSEAGRFVFKAMQCAYCDTIVYNSNTPFCASCDKQYYKSLSAQSMFDELDRDLIAMENHWLYGGL